MSKIIGITSGVLGGVNSVNRAYVDAFTTKDTIPLVIPMYGIKSSEVITVEDIEYVGNIVDNIAEKLDALVVTGGGDINPIANGEKFKYSRYTSYNRDLIEMDLIKKFVAMEKPVIGICRGFQMLGILSNLKLSQELSVENIDEIHNGSIVDPEERSEPIHEIQVLGDLKEWSGFGKMNVNSFHHQGFLVNSNPSLMTMANLEVIARTEKVIEGFRHTKLPVVGFQFHPEEVDKSIIMKYIMERFILI